MYLFTMDNFLNKTSADDNYKISKMLTNRDYLLEDIVLMKNTKVTQKFLEQTNFRCNSESVAIKNAMNAGDVNNVRVLISHGRGWKTRRTIFEREILRLISSDDLTSAQVFLEQLPSWNIINENFVVSLRFFFEQGTFEVVRMLLKYKIDEYVREKFGVELLLNVFGNSKINVTELLKNTNFDVNVQDISGETALHSAVENDVVKNVKFLLERGANPNSRDCAGWTPMFVIKSVECMELLLEHGANLQCIDKDGYTIFDSLEDFSDNIAKVALANLAIKEADGEKIRQEIRDKIKSNEKFRSFYKNCHQEIEWMRESNGDLFTILNESKKGVAECLLDGDIISKFLEHMNSGNGYVHSLLENKLKGVIEIVKLQEKNDEVGFVEKKDVSDDPCHNIIETKNDRQSFKYLVMFLCIILGLVFGFYFNDDESSYYCKKQRF